MKKILVPYDFSESSETALAYARELARTFNGELILLCVNHYPVMSPEVGLSAFTYQDAREDSLKALETVASKIKNGNDLLVQTYSEMGDVSDQINSMCEKQKVDLVVMGISGHGNKFIKTLAGSSAIAVSKGTRFPVLIVPPGVMFKKPGRIAYACNYGDDVAHPATLNKVKDFCKLFEADLHLIHIVPENHPVKHTEVVIENYLEHKLEESVHRTFIVTEKKASESLIGMLKSNLVDLIVIEPKKHNFFENLFHHSVTTELVFHSPVPVLTIHGLME